MLTHRTPSAALFKTPPGASGAIRQRSGQQPAPPCSLICSDAQPIAMAVVIARAPNKLRHDVPGVRIERLRLHQDYKEWNLRGHGRGCLQTFRFADPCARKSAQSAGGAAFSTMRNQSFFRQEQHGNPSPTIGRNKRTSVMLSGRPIRPACTPVAAPSRPC